MVVVIGDDVGLGDPGTDRVDGTKAVWTGAGRPPTPTLRGGWWFPAAPVPLSGLPVAVLRKGLAGL